MPEKNLKFLHFKLKIPWEIYYKKLIFLKNEMKIIIKRKFLNIFYKNKNVHQTAIKANKITFKIEIFKKNLYKNRNFQ